MRIFGVAGWSGSGKTTLVVRLLPEFVRRGIAVSTMKHAHHDFDVDQPGKDSYEHRRAGAREVMVASATRWALMHEHRGAPEPGPEELARHMSAVDLLVVEGFKAYPHDKLEVHRPSVGKPLLCRDDPRIVAVASDGKIAGLKIPVLPIDDLPRIAEFILAHCGLEARRWPS